MSDPAERAAFLNRVCAGNLKLRNELVGLLDAHFETSPLDRESSPNTTKSFANEAGKGAMADKKKVSTLLNKLDKTCVDCHKVFKD